MTMRDMDKKRAYDRERMARLYAAGQTWWQRRGRYDYDHWRGQTYRTMVRRAERIAADGWDDFGPDEVKQAKVEARELFTRFWQGKKKREAFRREHGECQPGKPERRKEGILIVIARPCVNPAHEGLHQSG